MAHAKGEGAGKSGVRSKRRDPGSNTEIAYLLLFTLTGNRRNTVTPPYEPAEVLTRFMLDFMLGEH